jgi:trehalose/maltose hydrolase-like predicted phosphorylase
MSPLSLRESSGLLAFLILHKRLTDALSLLQLYFMFSGIEVGPPESKYEIHPGGDISHAIMQYIYMTKDVNFYAETAKKLLIDICNFYQSRFEYNSLKRKYVYNGMSHLL